MSSPALAVDPNQGRPRRPAPKQMTLPEAIVLAIRDNIDVQNAYLDRVTQKFDLKVAEHKFKPTIDLSADYEHSDSEIKNQYADDVETTDSRYDSGKARINLNQNIPGGANFTFSWEHDITKGNVDQAEDREEDSTADTWRAALTQPLLRGAGYDVSMASVRQARISEQQYVLDLKATLISTVTRVINNYYSLVQAEQELKIARRSLDRARQLLDENKAFIEAGRMAKSDLIQSQSNVANQKIAYQQAVNSLDSARLTLLKTLNMDKNTRVTAMEHFHQPREHPTYQDAYQIGLTSQPTYLQAKLTKDYSEQTLLLAENNKLWDLNLQLSYDYSDTSRNVNDDTKERDWTAGLALVVPLYGETQLSREQQLVSARANALKAQNSLTQARENLQIDLDNALRDLEINREQVELAKEALELSQLQLNNEQEKLKFGKSTNFQVVTYQNDLAGAESNKLDAEITYLNSLAALDQILGTTLDTWRIAFKTQRPAAEKMVMDE